MLSDVYCGQNAFEEGGELHGQKVYLFGCTERKWQPELGLLASLYTSCIMSLQYQSYVLHLFIRHALCLCYMFCNIKAIFLIEEMMQSCCTICSYLEVFLLVLYDYEVRK